MNMRRSLKAKMGSLSIKNKKASATFQNRKGSWLLTVHFLPPLASHKTRSLINDGGGNYENTNITGKRAVNHPKTQLNDALIESCAVDCRPDFPGGVVLLTQTTYSDRYLREVEVSTAVG